MKLKVIKYYKLTDPVTKAVTKDYGWVITHTSANRKILFEEEGPHIVRNEPVQQTFNYAPRGQDIQEITEVQFNSLDTSKESMISRINREKNFLYLEQIKQADEPPFLNNEELIKQLKEKLAQGKLPGVSK